ncbi:hypothetical protein EPI10_006104 [Gossypium australe]|uniref:Uncharacterized protein n=1 Tax=Gossypium australe TaxID=47621 RepID=A0A5B6WSV1_9ROSI|nr:hypothetical protein EPI10_006104 [Gossypium australe]
MRWHLVCETSSKALSVWDYNSFGYAMALNVRNIEYSTVLRKVNSKLARIRGSSETTSHYLTIYLVLLSCVNMVYGMYRLESFWLCFDSENCHLR